jgi:hypothetical protein
MHKKKGLEPKFEAFSPDGYSGGKGGAARLKRYVSITMAAGIGSAS